MKQKSGNNIEINEDNDIFDILDNGKEVSTIDANSDQIKDLIYTIRGKQVMLGSDLARLYQVQTKVLNQAVKRNIKRFPDEFMFRLTEKDIELVRSQNVTSRESKLFKGQEGGRRYLPYVFNQNGVAMLSAILKSDIAIDVSIKIMKAFVEMRHFLLENKDMFARLNDIELNQLKYQDKVESKFEKLETKQLEYQKTTDEKFEKIFDYISDHKEIIQKIFFDGQIYDAFSLLSDLVKKANDKIILIDNYVDKITLDVLSKKKENVKVDIHTLKTTKLSKTEIDKFNKQYKNLRLSYTNKFHDRFLILDDLICYHIGASIKDAGTKSFGINQILDKQSIIDILNRLK